MPVSNVRERRVVRESAAIIITRIMPAERARAKGGAAAVRQSKSVFRSVAPFTKVRVLVKNVCLKMGR